MRPPPPSKAKTFWNEYSFYVCGTAGLLIMAAFFIVSLRKVGKRPKKPIVIPTFRPPHDLAPASVNYITARKYRNAAFTATLVDMAVKGAVHIQCSKSKKYSLVNTNDTERLSPEEKQIHETLFKGEETVLVDRDNHKIFSRTNEYIKNALSKGWNINDFFRANKEYVIYGGIVLNWFFILYLCLMGSLNGVDSAFFKMLFFIIVEYCFMLAPIYKHRNEALLSTLAFLPFFALMFVVPFVFDGEISDKTHWPSAVFFAVMSISYIIYALRIKRFTPEGARLYAELQGFKMYIKTAEEHRLNMLTPPERTPELFERLLPYAIALNVSNEWCEKFGDVLRSVNYRPSWYGDERLSTAQFSTAEFTSSFTSLGTSFNDSLDISKREPYESSGSSGSSDWSSGSSGGGYSGGGGGGGGVRGC
jgi:uncharacterized membrane protein